MATRIVRKSEYSPASALFAEIVESVAQQNLVKLSFLLKILSGNEIMRSIKGNNSVTDLQKMMVNNPN